MKKVSAVIMGLVLLAGCSKNTQYTNDLSGTWYIYNLTYYNVSQSLVTDSLVNYTITFTSNGQFTTQNSYPGDTLRSAGTWQFQNSYGQLVLTDTLAGKDTFTIFDLTGNSVQLLRDGYDRYMRKQQ